VSYSLSANEQAYQAVDQTMESQQNLRAVLDLIERDVRHAALMMPEAASACGVDSTSGPDMLYLSDGSAIDPGADTAEYGGAAVVAGAVVAGTAALTLDSMVMEPTAPFRAAVDTDADGVNDSDFRPKGGVIFFDSGNADAGVACGRITALDAAAKVITVQIVAPFDNPGAITLGGLRAVPANEYRIEGTDLLWNGIVLAGNIEDLQVAWIFDTDGDNLVNPAKEVYGASGVAPYDSSGSILGTNYENAADLREVRVNLVARTRLEDQDFTSGRPQALENRNGAAFQDDGFRRRVLTSRLRLRNLGIRG
jgi:hypothetical protein